MEIYVGRWDMLPKEWDGRDGLRSKSKTEIEEEVLREQVLPCRSDPRLAGMCPNTLIGVYSFERYEETFNKDIYGHLSPDTYWIRIL